MVAYFIITYFIMSDRHISKKLKWKVMGTCVTPSCIYGMETVALPGAQQQRLQVCENNWIRRIAGLNGWIGECWMIFGGILG